MENGNPAIGVLQCDRVRAELQPSFGDYPDMFRELLSDGALRPIFRVYDLTAGDFPASTAACDAWLFTGSKWSVNDPDEWIARAHGFARRLHAERRPTVGICFGHQLIASALGGQVERAGVGWGVGVHSTTVLRSAPWMTPACEHLSLLVSHRDQVTAPPPGAERLAGHDFCPHAVLRIADHILTFQGHPEFAPGYARALMERRRETLGEERYRAGIASLERAPDASVAAGWIHGFLRRALAPPTG